MVSLEKHGDFTKRWFIESSTYNFSINLTLGFVNAFIVKVLGYGPVELGYQVATRILAVALAQPLASFLVLFKRNKRKLVWFVGGAINRVGWSLAVLALLLPRPLDIVYLHVLAFIAQFAGGLANVAAMDTVGDNISPTCAMEVFSKANELTYVSTAASQVLGVILFLAPLEPRTGYIATYALGFVISVVSTIYLAKIPDRGVTSTYTTMATPFSNLRRALLSKELRRYLLVLSMFNFAVNVPAPFWDYIVLQLSGGKEFFIPVKNTMALLAKFFTMNWWKSAMQKRGLKKVLVEGLALTSLVPALYAEATNITGILVAEIVSGVVWAPVDVGTSIYSVYLPPGSSRPLYLSTVNFLVNTVSTIAASVGTTMYVFTHDVHSTLVTSTALRLLTASLAYKLLPEVTEKESNVSVYR